MMMEGSTAALVISGTGMLASATCWLAARSTKTLLVARRASRFAADLNSIIAVDADWREPSFPTTMQEAIDRTRPIDRALLWLHAPEPVLPWLLPLLPGARVVLVLGSLDGKPTVPTLAAQVATVRLGSVATPHGRRWLSDEEISGGAIDALQSGKSTIVGELAPAS